MVFFILIIGILSILLALSIVACVRFKNSIEAKDKKLSELSYNYYGQIYINCVLTDKLEKIKSLNLIDSENGYYKELLSTEIK